MAKILSAKPVVEALSKDLSARMTQLHEQGICPKLCILRLGAKENDLAYERTMLSRGEKLGIQVQVKTLPETASQEVLEAALDEINEDASIHGCIMFRPLPEGFDEQAMCNRLAVQKDVDGASSASLASVFMGGQEGFPPATAQACLTMLDHYHIPLEGKRVVVCGRSLVIGKPVAMLLLNRHASVTIAHSRSHDLRKLVHEADIVITAVGRGRMFGPEYFRPGQVVLDVGINITPTGELCGDVDFAAVEDLVEAITPVPGGLGSVTTSVTMEHVIRAAEESLKA